jgi:hypothetical protein
MLFYGQFTKHKGIRPVTIADKIRTHAREKYALPARKKKAKSFSIKAGDVVHELKIAGYAPAVCSALKTREFLRENELRLIGRSGPPSGQSTTVTYTYEFVDTNQSPAPTDDSWKRLRGALKDVFKELGGGEAYMNAERIGFYKRTGDK